MGEFINKVIPHVGIKIDASLLFHFARDLLVTLLLWLIGFRDFQAAFITMLASGFLEVGNGIAYQSDGTRNFFDFLDFLPSVVAGFLIVSLFSKSFELTLLLKLFAIYAAVVILLFLSNKLLGRKFIFEK